MKRKRSTYHAPYSLSHSLGGRSETSARVSGPLPLHTLAAYLHGELIVPDTPEYESGRVIWDGTADHHPALIVRCATVHDVQTSVAYAREQQLPIAVRSGGHSPAGYGSNDGGMVIDLSGMKAISIDATRRVARLEPGLTWGEVAAATQPYGLALTSGDTASVGVGGLLLGGGIGWMVRKYGMGIDHLRAVEVVLANGLVLRASAHEHADLFWGLRGGGGNFGIATAFEVELDPAGIILGGGIFYDITEAESILHAYAHYAATAPDELTTMALLMAAPVAPFIPPTMQGKPVVAIAVCYTGDLEQGAEVVAPLRTLGTPVADIIAPMPYPAMFALTQAATIPGQEQYVRSAFLRAIGDEVIHAMVSAGATAVEHELMVQLRVLGGAMSRVPVEATAFAHRDVLGMLSVFNTEPKTARDLTRQARAEQIWQTLRPYASGVYVNFLANEGPQRIHEAYPPATFARLTTLKQRYDPLNIFRLNQNIPPTA